MSERSKKGQGHRHFRADLTVCNTFYACHSPLLKTELNQKCCILTDKFQDQINVTCLLSQ